MKKLMIIMFVLFTSIESNAQRFTTYADTANYLISQIENKKDDYIGKPFSVLYDSLKIKPVMVGPDYTDINPNSQVNFARDLRFNFNYITEFTGAHDMIIIFTAPPPYDTVYPMFYPKENRASIGDIVNLYKPLIVKDIILKDYSEDEPIDPNVLVQQE